ncbi:BnaC01g44740D [Brassica napus]|uniref:BnaC01g44740D protein n=1 Tax=Brassica napus TaxID=3708 RepID=A0A078JN27_BRANA|nr:BnaC01g44740D [Brassica napus]
MHDYSPVSLWHNPQSWQKYLTHIRGSELESYLTRVVEENLKPQHVDQIKKIVNMLDEREMLVQICAGLGLDRRAKEVFGGELQWFAIAIGFIEKAETYMLDDSRLLKCGEVTTMSDLPDDLAEEILSRVPLTSLSAVRSTCRKWNDLSKNQVFGKSASTGRKQFLGFMLKDYKVCSMKFDLQGIGNEVDFVDPSIKEVSILDQVEITQVFHCGGLLLCVTKDRSRLLVWNPYLGQTRWIQPRNTFRSEDRYAYDTKGEFGSVDKYLIFGYEIYDLSSNSWKVFNVKLDRKIHYYQRGVSLNGHTFFLAEERWSKRNNKIDEIISFDFTTERFGEHLPLPIKNLGKFVSLSCVREEQLAVLHQSSVIDHTLEIWVSSNIDLGAVSWSKFLRTTSFCRVDFLAGSFFIDEEKKVAVVVDLDNGGQARTETRYNQRANIIGQDEYFKPVNVGKALDHGKLNKFGFLISDLCRPLVCSYVPSSVQLQVQPGNWKEGDD